MIVFSFAQYVYIEYRNEGMTILGSFSVSNKQVKIDTKTLVHMYLGQQTLLEHNRLTYRHNGSYVIGSLMPRSWSTCNNACRYAYVRVCF